jgi:hypothetical protein
MSWRFVAGTEDNPVAMDRHAILTKIEIKLSAKLIKE